MRAVFRDVKINEEKIRFPDGRVQYDFKDDAIFEVAAYELSRILGLDNLPPTIVRSVKGKEGTLQVWIEKSITETMRIASNQKPPDAQKIQLAHQTLRLFDNLIYNEDRNQGNILYDRDWDLWMIDHTRSFRTTEKLYNPSIIFRCSRELFDELRAMDEKTLNSRLGKYLTAKEIQSILIRRDLLVEKINSMVKTRGEDNVFF
jgi:hypothetical protein